MGGEWEVYPWAHSLNYMASCSRLIGLIPQFQGFYCAEPVHNLTVCSVYPLQRTLTRCVPEHVPRLDPRQNVGLLPPLCIPPTQAD